MRILGLAITIASAGVLAACAGGLHQTSSTLPTVSYSYDANDDPDDVTETAELYCEENYGRNAVLQSRNMQGDRFEATFACQ